MGKSKQRACVCVPGDEEKVSEEMDSQRVTTLFCG